MNTTIVLTILIWTLVVAGFGSVIGQAFSDQSNRRRSANQELRDLISRLRWDAAMLDHQFKKALDMLNDIRTRILPVSTGLENLPPKLHGVNSWISPSTLFHKVWIRELSSNHDVRPENLHLHRPTTSMSHSG